MKPNRMFLSQRRMNEAIAYCVLIDIVLGVILKKFQANHTGPLIFLYVLNLFVLAGVYRFWKAPLFAWDNSGFIFYGISPFKKDVGVWQNAEKAGFKQVKDKKGREREYLIIIFTNTKGRARTGAVPMDIVGFADNIKKELQALIRNKQIKPL